MPFVVVFVLCPPTVRLNAGRQHRSLSLFILSTYHPSIMVIIHRDVHTYIFPTSTSQGLRDDLFLCVMGQPLCRLFHPSVAAFTILAIITPERERLSLFSFDSNKFLLGIINQRTSLKPAVPSAAWQLV